jgi:hypothetical protein
MKQNPDPNHCQLKSLLVQIGSRLSLLSLSACGDPATPASKSESISATTAEAWLALMDQGDYAKSWETAADSFRKEVTKNDWVANVTGVRKPLGDLISRKVSTTKQMTELPGLPAGRLLCGPVRHIIRRVGISGGIGDLYQGAEGSVESRRLSHHSPRLR